MHVPVLLHEILQGINPRSGGMYLDGTLGGGGYAEAILDSCGPDGILVGLDLDGAAIERCRRRLERFADRFIAVHRGFHEAREVVASRGIQGIDGAVLDLGLSSDQLDDPDRGFSFQAGGPLDMRFDTGSGENVIELLRRISSKELETILLTYGEERYFRRVARSIFRALDQGRLKNTEDLARVVAGSVRGRRGKIHPATRTFQALRIAVNREIGKPGQGFGRHTGPFESGRSVLCRLVPQPGGPESKDLVQGEKAIWRPVDDRHAQTRSGRY